jgi:type II secretory pathway component PulJ
MARHSRGAALLEVIVALAILASAGLSSVALLNAATRAVADARERERVLAAEERVLAAVTLLRRAELDQRIGRHDVGEFVVIVQRPERTLYRIAIAQARSAHVEDLVTVVYRQQEQAR